MCFCVASYILSSFTIPLQGPFCWTPSTEPCLCLWEGFTFVKTELGAFGIRKPSRIVLTNVAAYLSECGWNETSRASREAMGLSQLLLLNWSSITQNLRTFNLFFFCYEAGEWAQVSCSLGKHSSLNHTISLLFIFLFEKVYLFIFFFIFMCMCASLEGYMCTVCVCVCVDACGCPWRSEEGTLPDQMGLSYILLVAAKWMLGIEPQSPASVLNYWAISQDPLSIFYWLIPLFEFFFNLESCFLSSCCMYGVM